MIERCNYTFDLFSKFIQWLLPRSKHNPLVHKGYFHLFYFHFYAILNTLKCENSVPILLIKFKGLTNINIYNKKTKVSNQIEKVQYIIETQLCGFHNSNLLMFLLLIKPTSNETISLYSITSHSVNLIPDYFVVYTMG